MDPDPAKIDAAVPALRLLGRHGGDRTRKGFDWDALDRLHAAGLISDPRTAAKSVAFTAAGLARAERAFAELFAAGAG